jgi:hypothetical protein
MSRQPTILQLTRLVLFYLRRYLETNPGAKQRAYTLHRRLTGRDLDRRNLWKHTQLKTRGVPDADAFFFYLVFLKKEKAILPGKNSLFVYAHKHLLK